MPGLWDPLRRSVAGYARSSIVVSYAMFSPGLYVVHRDSAFLSLLPVERTEPSYVAHHNRDTMQQVDCPAAVAVAAAAA